jgi:CBS domain-containing protein
MKARDVMVSPVITTSPHASVQDVAKTLIQHRISALPVLDHTGKLVGMISEGDLLHRVESNTERRRPWWLDALASSDTHALNYAKSHARRVSDLMTKNVITAAPDTPLYEIAAMLERHSIKRVPIVERGQFV